MSDLARAMVWAHYDPKRWGAPLILAIALSDEADDRGGGIFQSNEKLAKKTRQGERATRQQLRNLEESGLLECVERSAGGAGNFNHYRLKLSALMADDNPVSGAGLTRLQEPGYEATTRLQEPGSGLRHINTYLKDFFVDDVVRSRVDDRAEDVRLARWMFDKLKALNSKHRQPSWSAWEKDIRLMRERDKRSRKEIALLFAWANADPFWQSNILSPGKLREKWEQLELKRRANGGADAAQGAPAVDRSCARLIGGTACGKPGTVGRRDGTWRCRACEDIEERERANEEARP